MLEFKEIKWMLKRSNVLTVYILLPFLREKEKEERDACVPSSEF